MAPHKDARTAAPPAAGKSKAKGKKNPASGIGSTTTDANNTIISSKQQQQQQKFQQQNQHQHQQNQHHHLNGSAPAANVPPPQPFPGNIDPRIHQGAPAQPAPQQQQQQQQQQHAPPPVQHHPHHPQQGPPPVHLQHPRPSSIVHQQHHPGSPHQPNQAQHPGSYNSPHVNSHQLPLQHQSPYSQQNSSAAGQAHPEVSYYNGHPSPYGTPSSTQYSQSAETPDLMAAAQMQRPYQAPPIQYTPQSNSPASVASPQSHDPHGRGMYGQPQSQMPQGMYYPSYPPMSQVHHASYNQHQHMPQQHQNIPSQPLVSHQQNQQPLQQHQTSAQVQGMTNSPRPKVEPPMQQRPMDQQPIQRPTSTAINTNIATTAPPQGNNAMHQNSPGGSNNAAPGPIPATTPLVVRQDNNGVQWIAFEYSRDRVKMEYTIRCDVESVNVDELSQEFKTENCVYPRACCSKENYRGNRLIYETECNTVGWALADLNPCLRGKRGLIQRAVDSWRNSNQDPKLRSRRVRRQAKLQNRTSAAVNKPSHMAGPGGPVSAPQGVPSVNPTMGAPLQRQPQPAMGMGNSQLHHHHNHPDGNPQGGDDVSGAPPDLRQSQVFQGYGNYPSQPGMGSSIAPQIHDSMDGFAGHHSNNSSAIATSKRKASSDAETTNALYGDLPEAKRRKFILVDDAQRQNRVRVRVTLDQVEMSEIPDSYRKDHSVFPRAYIPLQMKDPLTDGKDPRFFEDADNDGGDWEDHDGATLGKTLVRVPLLGEEARVEVPKISRAKKRRENTLNELGYRMSWSQSRVFAHRTLFLQKSLDAYRNKMRSTIIQNAQSAEDADEEVKPNVPAHFHTRRGKGRWLERNRRGKKDD